MIVKLKTISYLKNALLYCEKGGELFLTNKCFGNASSIYKQMEAVNSSNDKCLKQSFHIKIRPAPEDKSKLSIEDYKGIIADYALTIGFEQNMYVAYIHEKNTEKEHIHIVASRIKEDNTAVNNSFTHYKNLEFSRKIEEKYKLRKVKRKLDPEIQLNNIPFISSDKRVLKLKKKIDEAIEMACNLEDLTFYLKQEKIKLKKGRGITFIDEKKAVIKGSKIGRNYSLQAILNRIEENNKQVNQLSR